VSRNICGLYLKTKFDGNDSHILDALEKKILAVIQESMENKLSECHRDCYITVKCM